ncbi:MAG: single-stranded-DNA-specific exonuclease RecJ [Cycloclasticus sp. symbiont of Poecilosclerida sp. N]|nr:MAG: single-stranded-DNA-specific exonuclease RecJ [Cycloclasticus sp. symbiont of Poecilosclerida sp. N]
MRTNTISIQTRKSSVEDKLSPDIHPILRQVYLNRGISSDDQLDRSLAGLPSYKSLSGIDKAADILLNAIKRDKRILIVADFDADGATSCVVAVRGLRMLGARHVDFVVPDRFKFGYGLTPEIVDVALRKKPDLIVTVDNGISSIEGVAHAVSKGCQVIVTDHHLPPVQLPNADVIVNPQLKEDGFPSKALAGVGVMFYVLVALRARCKEEGEYEGTSVPNLASLLDIVALGTVADVVPLDNVNRRLVHQGLLRIQQGQCVPGIHALLQQAKREPERIAASDLGFSVGPRLNAAGRLDNMALGIECLLTDDKDKALRIAEQLDLLNQERRGIEDDMKLAAYKILKDLKNKKENDDRWGICLFDETWHQGVIGILASRIKDRFNLPVIAFASASTSEIKGSARSIAGLHIRDVLDDIACQYPQLLKKFGGHAMAAGLSIATKDYEQFVEAFNEAVKQRLNHQRPENVYLVDGEIPDQDLNMDLAEALRRGGPWGQLFPEPSFTGSFRVRKARIVGQKHLKWELETRTTQRRIDAIYFNPDDPEGLLGLSEVSLAYQLDINEYGGRSSLQLMVRHLH